MSRELTQSVKDQIWSLKTLPRRTIALRVGVSPASVHKVLTGPQPSLAESPATLAESTVANSAPVAEPPGVRAYLILADAGVLDTLTPEGLAGLVRELACEHPAGFPRDPGDTDAQHAARRRAQGEAELARGVAVLEGALASYRAGGPQPMWHDP